MGCVTREVVVDGGMAGLAAVLVRAGSGPERKDVLPSEQAPTLQGPPFAAIARRGEKDSGLHQ